jgi:site-specific DNA-methyltransferase (adenine-specific)
MNYIINGDSLQELKKLPENSIDSVVTDPPYELGFMGKSWDNSGIANNVELWEEVLRVLKPGGHMLAFSGTRTYHRMVSAIEDAGFEIRDMINWTYGSGFPKNHDIGKKVEQYKGFGTALKPSHEPIVLARKPVEGTIADNVLIYGTGAINIDDSRIDTNGEKLDVGGRGKHNRGEGYGFQPMGDYEIPEGQGRYPANTILAADEEVAALFPNDNSRYFQQIEYDPIIYQAKAGKKERNKGLEEFEEEIVNDGRDKDIDNPYQRGTTLRKNTHPTVKPIKLMEYLVKLITPPGGVVLDPFAGSGTTLIAAKTQGFNYIGIELTPEYVEIAEARLKAY